MEFKDKVLQVRLSLDMSQENLAKELSISYPTVHRWEKGLCTPSMLALNKFNRFCEKHHIVFEEDTNK